MIKKLAKTSENNSWGFCVRHPYTLVLRSWGQLGQFAPGSSWACLGNHWWSGAGGQDPQVEDCWSGLLFGRIKSKIVLTFKKVILIIMITILVIEVKILILFCWVGPGHNHAISSSRIFSHSTSCGNLSFSNISPCSKNRGRGFLFYIF